MFLSGAYVVIHKLIAINIVTIKFYDSIVFIEAL